MEPAPARLAACAAILASSTTRTSPHIAALADSSPQIACRRDPAGDRVSLGSTRRHGGPIPCCTSSSGRSCRSRSSSFNDRMPYMFGAAGFLLCLRLIVDGARTITSDCPPPTDAPRRRPRDRTRCKPLVCRWRHDPYRPRRARQRICTRLRSPPQQCGVATRACGAPGAAALATSVGNRGDAFRKGLYAVTEIFVDVFLDVPRRNSQAARRARRRAPARRLPARAARVL